MCTTLQLLQGQLCTAGRKAGKPGAGLCRPGLTLQVQDALDYVRAAHADGAVYDLVLVDAFDGQDQIPAAFTSAGMLLLLQCMLCATSAVLVSRRRRCHAHARWQTVLRVERPMRPPAIEPCRHIILADKTACHTLATCFHHGLRLTHAAGSTFMACLPEMLHPRHGTLIMNIHGGFLPNPLRQMRAKLSGSSFANAGFDPTSNQGAEVLRLAHLYRSGTAL